MRKRNKIIIAGAVVAAAAAVPAAAIATGDDAEQPITGAALEQATAAALEHTGGGRVTDTEVGDEESYYEVEVTLDDGTQVDVQLDEQFEVVGTEVEVGGDGEDGADVEDATG